MYAIREGLKQVFRHPTASLATFFTALVSFTLLYFLGLLLWNLERVVQTMERELEVAAFLGPKADVEGLLAEIQEWPEVASARLQTKEEALAQAVQTLLPFVPALSPEDLGRPAALLLLDRESVA